jgi:hypothetical protein
MKIEDIKVGQTYVDEGYPFTAEKIEKLGPDFAHLSGDEVGTIVWDSEGHGHWPDDIESAVTRGS